MMAENPKIEEVTELGQGHTQSCRKRTPSRPEFLTPTPSSLRQQALTQKIPHTAVLGA